ncbi:MAG TPA: hypothetical protein VFA34_14305 [Actinomycetota bacterium]|nr:hypothetical protein [Actinomycetota bacterium]
MRVVFAVFFALFFVGWLVFDMPAALGIIDESTGFYAREVDPIFQDPPLWLTAVGWFAFAYGPMYGAAAFGFVKRATWLPYLLLPLAGMIVATTGIYFVEELGGDVRPTNWTLFYVLNIPYLAIPPLAAIYSVIRRPRSTGSLVTSAAL